MSQQNTPAGWHPDPQNPSQQRYWDGTQWTENVAPAAPPATGPYQKKKGAGSLVLKIALGIILACVLLFAGCAVLIGGTVSQVSDEIDKQQNTSAITQAQADSIKTGMTRSEVEAKLGKPYTTDDTDIEGFGPSSCTSYNVKGGEFLDSWQFCFNGSDDSSTLETKSKF